MRQEGNVALYAQQRRFLSRIRGQDHRFSVHLGPLEPRRVANPAAQELSRYLQNLRVRIEPRVFHDLLRIAKRHRRTEVMVEKAVDVMLSVDMVIQAERNEYDVAYLLSADGDFTPAVEAVKHHGKKVFVVSASYGAQLASAADSFIRLNRAWFADCHC